MTQLSETAQFVPVDKHNIHLILPLAEKIWEDTYLEIIGQEQIDYMLPMMYSNERILDELTKDYQWELLMQGDELLGYTNYKLMEDNRVFLSKLYSDVYRKIKGLGAYMFEHVLEYARQNGATAVYLTVNKNNQRAIDFYERNGMKCIESKTFDIGQGYVMDDYIYQIEL
ncbi:Acetyltransferase (GNAT) family protein [Myroides marinus]|uniref:Acetyltransferase (GNAT) family protein n=1 Tax=Myroides marinus TaxID=703342 RepID=A0A1H6R742_9FLAO|nr:GNAT family N-acetyltransferase [Myroides marinus]SEI48347.1 Acetyltransferase (GNAT) family protein [Myroides marinus]